MPPEAVPNHRRRRLVTWGALLGIILLFPCGSIQFGDGKARLKQTKALLQGSVAIPPALIGDEQEIVELTRQQFPYIIKSPNGYYYSKYGLGLSLIWLPPAAVAYVAHRVTGINFDTLAHFAISFVNPAITMGIALLLWSIWRRAGTSVRARSYAMLALLAGTMMLPCANTGFSEPLCALLLLAGVAAASRAGCSGRDTVVSGIWIGALATIKPELVLVPPLLVPAYWRSGWRRVFVYGMASSWGLGWILLTNLLQRGGPFRMSYGGESKLFGSPLPGLTGYFLGIDRNILLFNAGLLVAAAAWMVRPAREPWRRVGWSVVLLWLVFLAVYSSWWSWEGGWCFGPRFFVPLFPISFLPVAGFFDALPDLLRGRPAARAAVVLAGVLLLVVSLPIQMAGVSVRSTQAILTSQVTHESELLTQIKLLKLKLLRGPKHPEIYHKSDFVDVVPPDKDDVIDYSGGPPYYYLNHWWAIYMALKLQGVSVINASTNYTKGHP